jgi:uncharacterized protein (DUF58 family)
MSLILKPLYRGYRLFSWSKYWTLRRFTRPGQAVLGAVVVAATMSLDTEGSVGYQAFTLLVALLVVAVLSGFRFKAGFAVERSLPRFGTAGRPFSYRVTVRSFKRGELSGLALIEDLADPRPPFKEWKDYKLDEDRHVRPFRMDQRRRPKPFKFAMVKEATLPPLRMNQPVEVMVEMTPLRRGVAHLTGVTLARPDPLGLFRALRRIRLPQSVLILPRRYPLPPLALPGAQKYQQGGVALATNIGQSDEFVALRDYQRGDPPRRIHWRSWAKTGRPIVKEFEDEFFVRHALILDTFTERPHSEAFEEAVSVAASFACTVPTQESLLDLLFVESQAYCFTSGRGLAHSDQMLEILASVGPCRERRFDLLEQLVLKHSGAVSGCICVLLAWDEPRQRLVEKLKAVGLPVLALVIREPGRTEPLDTGPMRDDPGRLCALEIGRIEEQLAKLR